MVLKKDVTPHEILNSLYGYIMKYKEYLSDNLFNYLLQNYSAGFCCSTSFEFPSNLCEFYAEKGFLLDEHNIYLAFANLITKEFDIKDSSILEVGAGNLALVSRYLTEKTSKTVEAYDPRLFPIKNKIDNLKLYRQRLESGMVYNIPNLYVGLFPCDATELIIKEAVKNNRDFIVALCPCDDSPIPVSSPYYRWEKIDYIEDKKRLVYERGLGELHVTSFENDENSLPILYNKR